MAISAIVLGGLAIVSVETEFSSSVVVSGGYANDLDDASEIVYASQAGRNVAGTHVSGQALTRGNVGLVTSDLEGGPVRVARSAPATVRRSGWNPTTGSQSK